MLRNVVYVFLTWSGNIQEYLVVKLYITNSLLKKEFFEVHNSMSVSVVRSSIINSIMRDKLNIIQKVSDGRLYLKLQECSIPIPSHINLNTNISITPDEEITFYINKCKHQYRVIHYQQMAKADEGATVIFECNLCKKKLCRS